MSAMFATLSVRKGGISKRSNQGVSLIIVLIMLVIIGITAGTAMRTATSEQRSTNNLRMDTIAQQYAESALRYCEYQIQQVPDLNRPAGLQSANMPQTSPTPPNTSPPTSAWETTANWAAGSAILVTVPADRLTDANTEGVTTLPQCIAERQTVGASAYRAIVITARGFSPDYAADANGITTKGAVVWLQSVINAN